MSAPRSAHLTPSKALESDSHRFTDTQACREPGTMPKSLDRKTTRKPMRSLTDEQVLWALQVIRTGRMTQSQVAAELGVSPQLVSAFVHRRTYKHVQGFPRATRVKGRTTRFGLTETPERHRERESRFWSQIDMSAGPAACWPFFGAKTGEYGWSALGQSLVGSPMAFVAAYTLAWGHAEAPGRGVDLRHKCDNPPCCNPAHLLPGTRSDNLGDRFRALRAGNVGPKPVQELVDPPTGGWRIQTGDLDELERSARVSEYWARVDSSGGEDACWPWIGRSRNEFGYGQMRWDGVTTVTSHRIAYLLDQGLRAWHLPRTAHVRHRCPPEGTPNNCNNPRHLLIGSAADNRADAVADGTVPRGDHHHQGLRFPNTFVRQLRESYWLLPEGMRPTYTELARANGASINSVSRWLHGGRADAGGPTGPL
jgi:hypothetical protein